MVLFHILGLLFQVAFYMLPSIIAWYRRGQGKSIAGTFGQIVFVNFFVGWTVIGWFLALANAFGFDPLKRVLPHLVKHMVTDRPRVNAPFAGASGSGASMCGQCGGSGSTTCSSCGGRGSWYDPPQTATGSAQLRNCGACISSGRIRCVSCGGSGQLQALLH